VPALLTHQVEQLEAFVASATPSTIAFEMKSMASRVVMRPITDEGVAVGGAFDSDMAVGMMSIAHSRRRGASVLAIVIRRQEVRPMNAVSTVGAPLQSTIARLR
jgi:hypothetical protein